MLHGTIAKDATALAIGQRAIVKTVEAMEPLQKLLIVHNVTEKVILETDMGINKNVQIVMEVKKSSMKKHVQHVMEEGKNV